MSIYIYDAMRFGMAEPNLTALATGLGFFVIFAVAFYCYCFRRNTQNYQQQYNT